MDEGFNDSRIKSTLEDAKIYATRRKSKHKAEMILIKKAFFGLNNIKTILDSPCGIGRATFLLEQMGYKTTGLDAGEGAITIAKKIAKNKNIECTLVKANLKKIPFEDNYFDAVLCFRFFHHLKTSDAKEHIVRELCRVSKAYVLISYLSPISVTSMKRRLRTVLGGRSSNQQTTSLNEIEDYFKQLNYELVKDFSQLPFFHTLHLAVFKRNGF